MKLCPTFGNKELTMSPINQVRFGEIQIITSPLPQKSNSPHIIKPTHYAHKSDPSDYNNPLHSATTPKQRMRELGLKVEKNLNKRLPPVPIRHLDNGTGCELKNTEFPKFGFRTGLDKMYKSKCSSSPHLNHLDLKPNPSSTPKVQASLAPSQSATDTPSRYTRNPPPPLNLLNQLPPPKKISITRPTHKPWSSTQIALDSNPSDLSGFISNFKNTLPSGDSDSNESESELSPTKFDWIKNMNNHPKQRQSFAIQGNTTDLSGLDASFSESFSRAPSSPASYSPTSDSDSLSDHSLVTPKDDTTSSPLSQTLDILCGDSNNNSSLDSGDEPIHIPLSDIARANLGKWSQLRERKLTRRGNQTAGLGSFHKGRFHNAHLAPVTSQTCSQSENPSVTFAPSLHRKKPSLEESDLSYDLSGLLKSYKYPRHRVNNKGYEVHDDLSSILNLYLDPELIADPPALSTATSQDGDCEEDEANDTFDEVKSSLGLLERIHQGLKLTGADSHEELSDQDASGDVIDLYFPDLVYFQNGRPQH